MSSESSLVPLSKPVLIATALASLGALWYLKSRYWPSSSRSSSPSSSSSPSTSKRIDGECGQADLDALLAVLRAEVELSWPQLVTIREHFLRELREGLDKDGVSSMAMVPSLVTALPTGEEKGLCLALDVGGSNLRALLVELQGEGNYEVKSQVKKVIGTTLQQGDGEALFDFFALAVKELLEKEKLLQTEVNLGFTFSFPLQQTAINSGVLTTWTKGFSASGVIGKDVCALLHDALVRQGAPKVQIAALLNDTVGTMMAGAYEQRRHKSTEAGCIIGLILGTGTNACYWEQRSHITKLGPGSEGGMVINMECGNFGSRHGRIGLDLPLSRFDAVLNDASLNKNRQLMEKQISGMYLGELLRLLLRDAITKGKLCSSSPDALMNTNALSTETMSQIAADATTTLDETAQILARLGLASGDASAITLSERRFVRALADLVASRSARLAAVKIGAIARQMNLGEKSASVAVDGSLFEKYPRYAQLIDESLYTLTRNKGISLVLTKDGSGVGAAIAAFVLSHKKN